MTEVPKKRLFVAIGLPDEIKTKLQALQDELKPLAWNAKWVQPIGIHLTLKFLGYVDPSRVDKIIDTLGRISAICAATHVEVKGCGAFPNMRRPNVLWAGADSMDLPRIQEMIETALDGIGFEKENRAFNSHLTLARFRDYHGLAPLMKEVEKKKDFVFGEFRAAQFKLYESILHREGAEYRIIRDFLLEGTQWM